MTLMAMATNFGTIEPFISESQYLIASQFDSYQQ